MISKQEVEQLHKILIDTYGGAHGIRDTNPLYSALVRPFQTFDNKELHKTVHEKAASLIESILTQILQLDIFCQKG